MALEHEISIVEMGKAFVDLFRDEPVARKAWMRVDHNGVELWLLTEPIDWPTEQDFYSAVSQLYDRFPTALIEFHLINPRLYEGFDLEAIVPREAESLPFH